MFMSETRLNALNLSYIYAIFFKCTKFCLTHEIRISSFLWSPSTIKLFSSWVLAAKYQPLNFCGSVREVWHSRVQVQEPWCIIILVLWIPQATYPVGQWPSGLISRWYTVSQLVLWLSTPYSRSIFTVAKWPHWAARLMVVHSCAVQTTASCNPNWRWGQE